MYLEAHGATGAVPVHQLHADLRDKGARELANDERHSASGREGAPVGAVRAPTHRDDHERDSLRRAQLAHLVGHLGQNLGASLILPQLEVRDARPLLVGGPHLLPGGVAQPAARR